MKITADERRAQLLACATAIAPLATNRSIVPVHVSKVEADHEIRRVLEAIVRRWKVPPAYQSIEGRQLDAKAVREHMVPCRVIVDRMIMRPADCQEILETAVVIASISKTEHARLGGIYQDHEHLYGQMLTAALPSLPGLALQRYKNVGVVVDPI